MSPAGLRQGLRALLAPGRWWFAGGLMLGAVWVLAQVGGWTGDVSQTGEDGARLWFTVVYLIAGSVSLGIAWWLRHARGGNGVLTWIVLAGLAMRAVCLTGPPRHESDFYRYLWEGALVAHGHNPYSVSPRAALEDGRLAALTAVGRPVLERINHSSLGSIYPPVAQAVFALAYRLGPFDADALRGLFLAFDLATLALLVVVLRRLGRPLHHAAIYWWNPILVKEVYIAAHMEPVVVAFALAAVVAALWHWRRSGLVLLGVAMGAKLWPVVLAPILLRRLARSWRQAATGAVLFAATAVAVLWPLLASWRLGQDSGLHAYAHHWYSNAGLFSLLRGALHALSGHGLIGWDAAENAARFVSAGLLVGWLAILIRRRPVDDLDFARHLLLAVGGVFLLSPTQFPWYYIWLLPFLAVTPSLPLLLYTALLPLYHLHDQYPWVLWLEHLPVWTLLAWRLVRSSPPFRLRGAGPHGPPQTVVLKAGAADFGYCREGRA